MNNLGAYGKGLRFLLSGLIETRAYSNKGEKPLPSSLFGYPEMKVNHLSDPDHGIYMKLYKLRDKDPRLQDGGPEAKLRFARIVASLRDQPDVDTPKEASPSTEEKGFIQVGISDVADQVHALAKK